jgi:hypothetical protein
VLFNKHAMVRELTKEPILQLQLDAKKTVSDMRQLRSKLIQPEEWMYPPTKFSPKVDSLWAKGEQLGLW